jgi:hypothetical protein
MRQICVGLKATGSDLVLLSGWWAVSSPNFVLMFVGIIPFNTIQGEQAALLQAFLEGHLIPSLGISKVTFNGVPTRDPKTESLFTDDKLLSEVKRNLIYADLHIFLQPHWIHPPQLVTGPHSSISFAFFDPNGKITQDLAQLHLGKEITFKKWLVRPPLVQCGRCHKLGHQGPRCTLPKEALCCYICRG